LIPSGSDLNGRDIQINILIIIGYIKFTRANIRNFLCKTVHLSISR